MTLQINTMMRLELASPDVRHSRVQQNALTTSSTRRPQLPAMPHLSARDPERGATGPCLGHRTVPVHMAWHGMVEVCEGAPVAVSGWVLADRHDLRPCAASSLHRETTSVSNVIGGTQDNPKPIRTQPSCWTMFNFRDAMLNWHGTVWYWHGR